MKTKYLLFFCLAALFTACSNDEKVQPVSVSLEIVVPNGITLPESYTVEFTNTVDHTVTSQSVGNSGIATVSVLPGNYSIQVTSAEIIHNSSLLILSGTLTNQSILVDGLKIVVNVQPSAPGTLIIKELYYVGSRTASGGSYFRDQFYELYNNGEATIYLDGLYFGTLWSNVAAEKQPTWDKENASDYVYYQWLWKIPGTGTQYPLQPGESAVISQWGTDHQVETLNPLSPVNLASSEFEGLCPNATVQTDAPAINLELIWRQSSFAGMPQWLNSINGCAFAIFYDKDFNQTESLTTQEGSTSQGIAVPVSKIIEAVECVDNETKVTFKRIPTVLDAGATYTGATYTGKGVARKIKETKTDGRKIYQDTNNSTSDFEIQDIPTIRRGGANIPSWNTWK